jgi:hypothetical protein
MGVWDELKERLVVRYASEGEVVKPKEEDLERYEEESGHRLSVAYREFVLEFGPGTIGRGWQLSSPGFTKADSDVDLARLNERFRSDSHPNFIRFCGKEDFHGWFAWDPEDITDPVEHRYGLYLIGGLRGHESQAPPIKVASTFHEFIMSYALGGGFDRHQEGLTNDPGDPVLPETVGFAQVIS